MPKYRNKKTGEVIDAPNPEVARQMFLRSNRPSNKAITTKPSIPLINKGNKGVGENGVERGFEAKILDNLIGTKASNLLTTPILPDLDLPSSPLPEYKTGRSIPDFIYNDVIRSVTSPDWLYENVARDSSSVVGAAENFMLGKALKYTGKGIRRVLKGVEGEKTVVDKAAEAIRTKSVKKQVQEAAVAAGKPKAAKAVEKKSASLPVSVLKKIVDLNQELKGIYLSSGLPGTNINIHGLSLAARHAMGTPLKEGGFIKGGLDAGKYLLSQKATRNKLESFGEDSIKDALKHGVLVDPESFGSVLDKRTLHKIPGVKQVVKVQEELFEKPLFGEFAPVLKMIKYEREAKRQLTSPNLAKRQKELYDSKLSELLKRKVKQSAAEKSAKEFASKTSVKEAKEKAAEIATNFFGGYKNLMGGGQLDTVAKAALLAPDFYKTHFKLLGGMVRGVAKNRADDAAYRTMAANLAVATTALDVLNLHTSGRHIWENDNGYEMSWNTGAKDSNGKDVYVRVFGGAVDLPRLLFTMANSVRRNEESGLDEASSAEEVKKFIVNRMSPLGRPLFQLLQNEDWKGEQYYGSKPYPVRVRIPGEGQFSFREKYPLSHTVGKLAEDYSQVVLPQSAQVFFGDALRQSLRAEPPNPLPSFEEKATRALELPFAFKQEYSGLKQVKRKKPLTPEERKKKLQENKRLRDLIIEKQKRDSQRGRSAQ